MGARGPKAEPDAVKAAKAAVRSKRKPSPGSPAGGPAGAGGAALAGPKAPKWLDGIGLEIWGRLAPALAANKLLTPADGEAFGRYCRNFARWLKLQAELDSDGETYESESQHGKLKRANPAFLVADRLERMMLATEDRFGMNPSERQKIMAARLNTGVTGDLFGPDAQAKRDEDPATKAAPAAAPIASPIGMLN